jgi:hypothetical protein
MKNTKLPDWLSSRNDETRTSSGPPDTKESLRLAIVAPRTGGGEIFELLRTLARNGFVVTLLARDDRCLVSFGLEPDALALFDRMW